jgi:hypothetical protein
MIKKWSKSNESGISQNFKDVVPFWPVLWIRIGFNTDPDLDPAFYLHSDPDRIK